MTNVWRNSKARKHSKASKGTENTLYMNTGEQKGSKHETAGDYWTDSQIEWDEERDQHSSDMLKARDF